MQRVTLLYLFAYVEFRHFLGFFLNMLSFKVYHYTSLTYILINFDKFLFGLLYLMYVTIHILN
jgi:hypothetical protein